MTGLQTLLARTALGGAAATATVLLPRFRPAFHCSPRRFRMWYLIAFAAIRLLLFSVVFLDLRIAPRGDLPGIYIGEIKAHLAGGVPYRTYATSYAPLFPYLYGALYRLAPSPLTLIIFSILVEVATAAIFLRFMPRVLTEAQVRIAALLCLANPISLQFVTIDGQNNVLIALFLALALLWFAEKREALSGAAVGLSIVSVKFLPLLFTPVFPMFLRRRAAAWIATCGAVVVAVYGYFDWVLHAPVLQALRREGQIKSAGGLPFLVEAITGRDLGRIGWDALLLLALAAVLATGWCRARAVEPGSRSALRAATFLLPALLLTLMALGKKTWPTYTEMVLFPLGMVVATCVGEDAAGTVRSRALWLFGVFSLLCVTAHSVWSSLLSQANAVTVHLLLSVGYGAAWLLLLLELGLFATYAALTRLCLRQAGLAVPDRS
ncbi:MAG: DUF2029 domain-containing protein [Terriglobus roseus]|nr:DUF2029 domain-containing protein [Terriglobus roseus]